MHRERLLVLAIAGALPLISVAMAYADPPDNCEFCYENKAGTMIACHTIGACPSNTVCSGEGGEVNGVPWAQARCIPHP